MTELALRAKSNIIASSGIAVVSVLAFGCYDTVAISKEEVAEASVPITIVTFDGRKYRFEDKSYHIAQDTLFGKGIRILDNQSLDFDGKIPLSSIQSFQAYELNEARTVYGTLAILAAVAATVGLLILIFGSPSLI
jgi:hypothetical protein